MAKRLTVADLNLRIDAIEASFGMLRKTHEQLLAEMNAFYVAERPSRRMPRAEQFAPTVAVPIQSADNRDVVYLKGIPHLKVRSWAHGRCTTTYKPLAS